MNESLRPGSTMRVTEGGELVTVWSLGPRPGTYWCHLGQGETRPVVLVQVRRLRTSPLPLVTLEETA